MCDSPADNWVSEKSGHGICLFLLKLRTLYATSATHKTVTMCISKQGNMVTVFVHSTKNSKK